MCIWLRNKHQIGTKVCHFHPCILCSPEVFPFFFVVFLVVVVVVVIVVLFYYRNMTTKWLFQMNNHHQIENNSMAFGLMTVSVVHKMKMCKYAHFSLHRCAIHIIVRFPHLFDYFVWSQPMYVLYAPNNDDDDAMTTTTAKRWTKSMTEQMKPKIATESLSHFTR